MVIPAEITAKHRVSQEDVFRIGGAAPGISDAVFEFATIANDHLHTAREMFEDSGVDKTKAHPIFLAGVSLFLVSIVYDRLVNCRYPSNPSLIGWKPWILMRFTPRCRSETGGYRGGSGVIFTPVGSEC
jgi:NADH dehydrogenase [ubiquinone] 1 alpha subcomplex assembly factor 6